MRNRYLSAFAVLAAIAVAACESTKSSNPLSPTVAGPIPGVNISAPKTLEPTSGSKVAVDQQPITLLVENASSNGVRPLNYLFEVATDAGFTNKVFMREGIEPGSDGRTKLRLPDPLATGRAYYWRVKAQDGANTGPYSDAAHFNVFTPIVIQAPEPVAPGPNTTTASLRPQLVVNNAPRSGPVGPITYTFEVSENAALTNPVGVWTTGEASGQTKLDVPVDLKYSTVYYWRARASEPTTIGPWSTTYAFVTPAPAPIPEPTPTPSPLPPNSGPAANDGINLAAAGIYDSPSTVGSWPVTTTLSVSMGGGLIRFDFGKARGPGRWPDVLPPGWSGPLQYTLGMCQNINGRWACSAAIQYWYGREQTAPTSIAANWFYDSRWGPLAGRQPSPGETVGFFVAAGNLRGVTDGGSQSPVKERSNIVLVPFQP